MRIRLNIVRRHDQRPTCSAPESPSYCKAIPMSYRRIAVTFLSLTILSIATYANAADHISWLTVRYEDQSVKTFLQGPYASKATCDKLNQTSLDNVLTACGSCKESRAEGLHASGRPEGGLRQGASTRARSLPICSRHAEGSNHHQWCAYSYRHRGVQPPRGRISSKRLR